MVTKQRQRRRDTFRHAFERAQSEMALAGFSADLLTQQAGKVTVAFDGFMQVVSDTVGCCWDAMTPEERDDFYSPEKGSNWSQLDGDTRQYIVARMLH